MSQEYNTTSFYLACFLASKGKMSLLRVDREPGSRRAAFVFLDSSERKELVREFAVEDHILVDVKDFISQLRKLKSALYDGDF